MEANFTKLANGSLVPASEADAELLTKIKIGAIVKLKLTRMRNYKFHRKFFALVSFAFDYWEPAEIPDPRWPDIIPEKNMDRFRKDLIIRAGYYDATYRLNGDIRIEAKSIAFANMSEDEFEKLFSATIDVVLKEVCTQYTDEMLRGVVDQTLAFT